MGLGKNRAASRIFMDIRFEIFDIAINGIGNGWSCKNNRVFLIQKVFGTEPDLKIGDKVHAGADYSLGYDYVYHGFKQIIKNGLIDYELC